MALQDTHDLLFAESTALHSLSPVLEILTHFGPSSRAQVRLYVSSKNSPMRCLASSTFSYVRPCTSSSFSVRMNLSARAFSYGLPRRLMLIRISCSTSNFVYLRDAY